MRSFILGLVAVLPLSFSTLSLAEPDLAKIRQSVEKELGEKVQSISATAIGGMYEVVVPPKVFYMSADGRYVMTGDLIDLDQKVNLTQDVRVKARVGALENLGESSMITFAPKEVKHTITVFTDIDCGYCRKLHSEISEYNKQGIKVRYLAYPRAGIGSESYNKAVSVWCAKDRAKAMTMAKQGKDIEQRTCDNPVAKHFSLGQELGVNGTPALMLENGQIYPGYAPADKLISILEQAKSQSASR